MNKIRYQLLKKGDVVTHTNIPGYFIVCDTHDDEWVDVQDINKIRRKTELGYEHDHYKYEYLEMAKHSVLNAVQILLNREMMPFCPSDFIDGYVAGYDQGAEDYY